MKKVLSVLLVFTLMLGLVACGSGGKSSGTTPSGNSGSSGNSASADLPTLTLKFNHTDTAETSYHKSFTEWANKVNEYTDGKVTIQVYANGELAGERDSIEMLQLGTLDTCGVSSAPAGNFVKEFGILDAPFLYETDAQAYNASTGSLGKYLYDKSAAQGLHLLGIFCIGYRNMISSKPIKTLDDFKGVKVRLMENDLHVATFEALGALTTTMAYSEVYTALQQKTIDAAENTNQNLYTQKYYEVCPYVALTGHFYCMKPVFFSQKVWDTLPAQYQEAIQKAFDDILLEQWKGAVAANDSYLGELEKNGCEITNFDVAAFADKVKVVYSDPRFSDPLTQDLITLVHEAKTDW